MMRWLVCAAVVMAASGQAAAIDIWLSSSGQPSAPPQIELGVPTIHNFIEAGTGTGSVFVWARPDATKTLERWSLRLTSDNPNVLDFDQTEIEAYNLLVEGGTPEMIDPNDKVRWEFTISPEGDTGQVDLFGFNIGANNPVRMAEGIGNECNVNDQFCGLAGGPGSESWLLAKINYTLLNIGVGESTELKFQIGSAGISQVGESTSDASVRFGDANDGLLNGKNHTLEDGAGLNVNRDAQIFLHSTPDADFDSDSDVDGQDFLTWQRGFGKAGTEATKVNGDATEAQIDDIINEVDLAAWALQFGTDLNGLAALGSNVVPEPTSVALAASVCLFLLAGRRRPRCVDTKKVGD